MITNGEEMIMVLFSRGSGPATRRHAARVVTSGRSLGPGWAHGQDPDLDPDLAGAAAVQPHPATLAPDQSDPDPIPSQLRLHRRRHHRRGTMRLCRLRYGGSAHQWGFAIYRASHDDYEDSYLPNGYPVGTAEEALDTAC